MQLGAPGRIEGGHLLYHKCQSERQTCRLYLSRDEVKVRRPKFGDASKALEEV